MNDWKKTRKVDHTYQLAELYVPNLKNECTFELLAKEFPFKDKINSKKKYSSKKNNIHIKNKISNQYLNNNLFFNPIQNWEKSIGSFFNQKESKILKKEPLLL